LRRLEARGEVRGGRFVAGMVGEQFALPEAVEALRTAPIEGPIRYLYLDATFLDLGRERGNRVVEEFELGEDRADEEGVVGTEAPRSASRNWGSFLRSAPLARLGEERGIARAFHQRLEHRAAEDAEHVGGDRRQFDARYPQVGAQREASPKRGFPFPVLRGRS
jgi:hypothetical protein